MRAFLALRAARPSAAWRGFTLLELLVVVTVIVVMLTIFVPALEAAMSRAMAVRCLANVRQISFAAWTYAREHDVYVGWTAGADRKQLLYPYLHQGRSNADVDGQTIWHCPGNLLPDQSAGYGFNTYMNWERLTAVVQPHATVGLADAGINDDLQPHLATHLMPPSRISSAGIGRPNPKRHVQSDRAAVSVGWIDGHAETVAIEPPFYPNLPGKWTGNSITDSTHPDYKDQLWDLD